MTIKHLPILIQVLALTNLLPINLYPHQKQSYNIEDIFSEKNQDAPLDSILFLYNKALKSEIRNNYSQTEHYLKIALNLSKKTNNYDAIKQIGNKLEFIYRARLSDYEKSEKLNNYLMNLCQKKKDTSFQIIRTITDGDREIRKNNYVLALHHFNFALKLAQQNRDSLLQFDSYISKGILFNQVGLFTRAKQEFVRSLKLTKPSDSSQRRTAYINLSSVQNNIVSDSSIYYLLKAKSLCKDTNKENCYSVYNNIAWYYVKKNNPLKALEVINTNIDFDKIEFYRNDFSAILHTLGTIYQQLSDFPQSIIYYEKALLHFKKSGNAERVILTLDDLSVSLKKVGLKDKQIKHLDDYKHYYPLLYNSKLEKELATLEFNNLLNEKEKKISSLLSENDQMKNSVIKIKFSIYILIIVILAASTFIGYRSYITQVKFYKLTNSLAISRLHSLRAIMNPHFLFNSFSALQNFILKREHLKANEYMTKLSGLIRSILSNSNSIYIEFNKELEIIESYIEIEKGRLESPITIDYHIDNKLLYLNPVIPSMILQPYVENAIIHGLTPSKKKKKLIINFTTEEEVVTCVIRDNGVGRNYHKGQKKNHKQNLSIATQNTTERLNIITELGYKNAKVYVNDLIIQEGISGGTEVIIVLPIIKQKKIYGEETKLYHN
ncbi:histidine kinase [Aquimarina aquimarini]|uniref:histidine kinase n=1 Tax=Aquimarina aquimarini TaxID=1191734 RepID=UPI001F2A4E50|nr:histidine kinase [Aquimarina aquimarini]